MDASFAASWAALPAPAASGSPGLEGLAGLPPFGWKFSQPELPGFFGASAQKARLMASSSLRTASAAVVRGMLVSSSPRREAASAARAAVHVLAPASRDKVDASAPRIGSAATHPGAGAAGDAALRAALARALLATTANMSATEREAARMAALGGALT